MWDTIFCAACSFPYTAYVGKYSMSSGLSIQTFFLHCSYCIQQTQYIGSMTIVTQNGIKNENHLSCYCVFYIAVNHYFIFTSLCQIWCLTGRFSTNSTQTWHYSRMYGTHSVCEKNKMNEWMKITTIKKIVFYFILFPIAGYV